MRKWNRQPPAGTKIDWTNPITKGLTVCIPCNEGHGYPRELVSGRPLDDSGSTGTPSWVTIPRGDGGVGLTTGAGFLRVTGLRPHAVGNPLWTVFCLTAYNGGNANADALVQWYETTGLEGAELIIEQWTAGAARLRVYENAWGSSLSVNGYQIGDWEEIAFSGSIGPVDRSLYAQGHLVVTNAAPTNDVTEGTSSSVDLNCAGTGNGRYVRCVYAWNRELSAGEQRSLYENPWQILKGPKNFALADPLPQTRSLTVPKVWTEQPPVGTPIDWDNPLTNGLKVLGRPLGGKAAIDVVSGRMATVDGDGLNYGVQRHGPGAAGLGENHGAGHGYYWGLDGWGAEDGSHTVVGVYSHVETNADMTTSSVFCGVRCNSQFHYVKIASNYFPVIKANHAIIDNAAADNYQGTNLLWADIAGHNLNVGYVVTKNETTHFGGQNGDFEDLTVTVDYTDWYPTELTMGCPSNASFGDDSIGLTYYVAIWKRDLSRAELIELSKNPWQIFKAPEMHVPIEYEELTFDEEREERLFMIPQRARRQPK